MEETKKSGGLYAWIERVGNKIPHPFVLFIWLFAIVVAVAFVLGKAGVSAVNPTNGDVITVVNVHTAAASGRWCGAERPLCGLSNSRH